MSEVRICGACDAQTEGAVNLCTSCADALARPPGFCAEQLLSTAIRPSDAALIDSWGRVHPLEDLTPIGRRPVARGVSVLQASVSRNHAEISRDAEGRWHLADLGSSNGTFIDQESVRGSSLLPDRCRLTFGSIGLYFLAEASGLCPNTVVASTATIRPVDLEPVIEESEPEETTYASFPKVPTAFMRSSAGGNGFVVLGATRVQLTGPQIELLDALVQSMRGDNGLDIEVRGFVPTTQLIESVSWDTPYPTENHLKQLIRRVRKTLDSEGLGNLIESRRGFGYRLRYIPVQPAA